VYYAGQYYGASDSQRKLCHSQLITNKKTEENKKPDERWGITITCGRGFSGARIGDDENFSESYRENPSQKQRRSKNK
jgi:hypothetical protein